MANVDIVVGMIDKTKTGASSIYGSVSQLAVVAGLATTAFEVFSKAMEMSQEAAQMQRLADAGKEMASQFGGNMDLIIEKVKEASHGTVSEMDIIASANKAMMLGLGADANQLANLMEIAAFRGRAMGLSTTQAFDDIVRGIGRASPMILDNLGIVISAKETYDAYAEQIGKSASELTKAEKTQALLNAVLASGNDMLEKAGGLAEDNASSFERWNAELENTKNFITGTLLPMERLADMGSDLLVTFRELADNGFGYGGEKLNVFSLFMEFAESRVANMNEELANQSYATQTLKDDYFGVTEGAETYTMSLQEQEAALRAITDVNNDLLSLTRSLSEENVSYNEKLAETIAKYGEGSEEVAKLKEAHADAFAAIASDLLIAKLQADGFTDAEYNMAIAMLESTGQIDSAAAQTALAMDKIASAAQNAGTAGMESFGGIMSKVMEDGVISNEELQAALDELSAESAVEEVSSISSATDEMSAVGDANINELQSSVNGLSTESAINEVDELISRLQAIPTEVAVDIKYTVNGEVPPPLTGGQSISRGQSASGGGQVFNIANATFIQNESGSWNPL
jgi:hypothetical protein